MLIENKADVFLFSVIIAIIAAVIGTCIFLYNKDENKKATAITYFTQNKFESQYDRYRVFEYQGRYFIVDVTTNEFSSVGAMHWNTIEDYTTNMTK